MRAYYGSTYGSLDVTVTVSDVNEPPEITTTSSSATELSQDENRTSRLYTYRATDPEGEPITWTVGGVDGRFFAIDEEGRFAFSESTPPDFEQPGDAGGDNVYAVAIEASDGTNTGTLAVTVTVRAVDEGPEVSGQQSLSFPENQPTERILATYSARDPEDPTAAITRWSLSGTDGGDFTISESGELSFKNVPDYDKPADSGKDNVYNFSVRAYNGSTYGSLDVTVTVSAVNEPPEITTTSSSATELSQDENRTSRLYTYRATDPEGEPITWTVGGVDGRFFAIDEGGRFAFSESTPPDFEQPGDAGGDNVYAVAIEASDGTNTGTLAVTVTVRAVDEGPEVSGQQSLSFPENQPTERILATYSARDPEDPTAAITRWSLSGTDGGDFTISESGELSLQATSPDYDKPADSKDNVYSFSVRASDGRYYGTLTVTVTVEAVDEAPEFRPGTQDAFAYAENDTSAIYTYRASDPEGSNVTWGWSGTDSSAFTVSGTGVLAFTSPPDYESPADVDGNNVYELTVEARDANDITARLDVTVTVTNVTDLGPPSNLQVAQHESGQLRAFWNAPESGTPPTGYTVQWKKSEADWTDEEAVSEEPVTDTSHIIKGLTDGEEYDVRVIASKDATESAPSKEASATPQETTPPTPNSPATGAPTISGTAQVGETLTADTSGIADSDGLANATFGYQWLADATAIEGARGSTYTLTDSEAGKAIKVRVSFTDDADNPEDLTSAATAAVAAAGVQPTSATVDGSTLTLTYEENLDEGVTLPSSAFTVTVGGNDRAVNGTSVSGKTVNLTLAAAVAAGETVKVGYAKPDGPDFIRDTLGREGDSFSDHAVTNNTPEALPQQQAAVNTPATGAPIISGTAQVGETLTAEVSAIADADGLENATFTYQWVRVDGRTETDIPSAVAPAYHPTTDDVGKTIKVNVSFTDDAGHSEGPLVTAVTDLVEDSDRVQVLWTATMTTVAETVDSAKIGYGDPSTYPESSLVPSTFVVGSTTYTFREIAVDSADLLVHITPQLSAADVANWRFLAGATEFTAGTPVNEADRDYSLLRWDETDLHWNAGDRIALALRLVNTAATGAPSVTGSAQVGETLTADVSGITDADGKPSDAQDFAYHWIRVDGATSTDITGATAPSYTLAAADGGKTIKVTVGFTDLAGFSEGPLTSAATVAVAARPNSPATGQPTISGTAQLGETLTADASDIADADGLDNVSFTYQWIADDSAIAGATASTYTLGAADDGKAVKVRVSFTDDAGHAESLTSAAAAAVAAKPNSPATGQPTISGTAQLGETLTADTSDIADADGLDNVSFTYQWIADDSAIAGATASTYTLGAADDGKAVKVRVSFTDDRGRAETLTSAATDAVAVAARPNSPVTGAPTITGTAQLGETLTADTSGIADADGLDNATFAYQWIADDSAVAGATDATYTLAAADERKAIKVRVSFTDDAGHAESLTSAATAAVAAKPNSPATGQPTISGTAQLGETLTADTSGIADADGLNNAAFTYQWLADDADISGATSSSYTLADADAGKAIKVRVSFTDDAGNEETLTSAATAVTVSLTASLENTPDSHDGQNVFTFELRFSEKPNLSYRTLRDHAFTVAGGTVEKAERITQGSNIRWRITVRPDVDGQVTITLPATTDCDAEEAICTGDGRMLSNELVLTVDGPGQ